MAYNLNTTLAGLNSMTYESPVAGVLPISGKLTLPTLQEGATADSQVVVTITQTPNGGSPTTIYTTNPGAMGFNLAPIAAALDVFTITVSSSAAVDSNNNRIKMTVSIG